MNLPATAMDIPFEETVSSSAGISSNNNNISICVDDKAQGAKQQEQQLVQQQCRTDCDYSVSLANDCESVDCRTDCDYSVSLANNDSIGSGMDTASETMEYIEKEDAYQTYCSSHNSSSNNESIPSIKKDVEDNRDGKDDNKNDNHDHDDDKGDDDDDSNISSVEKRDSNVKKQRQKVSFAEPVIDAQEWTFEDHYRSNKQREQMRRKRRYERMEKQRRSKVMVHAVVLLLLEVAAATIAVMYHLELIECCGTSIFSENASTADRWDKIFYWIGITYLLVLILIEIPTLIIAQETLFLFNPMIGYLLVMQMMYAADTQIAYIIYGLETVAMLGQSMVLVKMNRGPESCLHSILNYTLAGITLYLLLKLTQQGGYCIVNDRIQSVFSESTCNINCIDEASCFRCTGGGGGDELSSLTQCFIRFE